MFTIEDFESLRSVSSLCLDAEDSKHGIFVFPDQVS